MPIIAGKYADSPLIDQFNVEDLQAALFPRLTQYYSEVSYSAMTLTGTVYGTASGGLIQAPATESAYTGTCNGHEPDCAHTGGYVRALLTAVDSPQFDWAQYDNDGDFTVDCVVIVFPTRDSNCGGPGAATHMGSHFRKLSDWGGPGEFITQSGHTVNNYIVCPLLSCNLNEDLITEIGYYAHELGHSLGIHDLYSNTDPADWCCAPRSGITNGVGYWDLMGFGGGGVLGEEVLNPPMPNNMHPNTPTHMSARTKEALGWLTPTVITQSQTSIRLDPVETHPQAIKIYPWGATSGLEYFLVEYRKAIGFDGDIPGNGLAIWRVTKATTCFCTDGALACQPRTGQATDIGLELIEADYVTSLNAAQNWGRANDLFHDGPNGITQISDAPGTNPCYRKLRTYNDEATGLSISNITLHNGGEYATFDLEIRSQDVLFSTASVSINEHNRGVSLADVDKDGFVDVYITRDPGYANQLFYGTGTTFTLGPTPGLLATTVDHMSSAWADIDNDGDSDVGLANLVSVNSQIAKRGDCVSQVCSFSSVFKPPVSPPFGDFNVFTWSDYDHDGRVDALLLGIDKMMLKGQSNSFIADSNTGLDISFDIYGTEWGDYSGDHNEDLLVLGHDGSTERLALFLNDGDGTFTNDTSNSGLSSYELSAAAWIDFDNDQHLDLYGGRANSNPDILLRNNGVGAFSALAGSLTGIQRNGETRSVVILDYDNDGNTDIYVTEGAGSACGSTNTLYRNSGQSVTAPYFTDETPPALKLQDSNFASTGDVDNDGFIDMIVESSDVATLIHNELASLSSNHWLQVKLTGGGVGFSNRSGIGARVEVTTGSRIQVREITGGRGNGQDWLVASFGLGSADVVNTLKVYWPSGLETELQNLSTDRIIEVNEPFHGTISSNTAWSGYVVLNGDVKVETGVTLTIAPGTQLLFTTTDAANIIPLGNPFQVELQVNGTLQINGSGPQFVSLRSFAEVGQWGGIILDGGSAFLNYAEIRDAVSGFVAWQSGGTWTLDHCTFTSNGNDIVVQGDASPGVVRYCTVDVGSGSGIKILGGTSASNISILNSTVSAVGGTGVGILVDDPDVSPFIRGNTISGFLGASAAAVQLKAGNTFLRGNAINNSNIGVYINGGAPVVGSLGNGNQITSNGKGIWAKCLAPGSCGSCVISATVRHNTIANNTTGVLNQAPLGLDLGNESDCGNNNIYGPEPCVSNTCSTTLPARGNSWGGGDPCTSGEVDTGTCQPGLVFPKTALPERTALVGITPNPFNPATTIAFDLKESVVPTLAIYNVSGQLVRQENLGSKPAGSHTWLWNGTDQRGTAVSSGIYFIVLKAGNVVDRRKAVLLK